MAAAAYLCFGFATFVVILVYCVLLRLRLFVCGCFVAVGLVYCFVLDLICVFCLLILFLTCCSLFLLLCVGSVDVYVCLLFYGLFLLSLFVLVGSFI